MVLGNHKTVFIAERHELMQFFFLDKEGEQLLENKHKITKTLNNYFKH